MHFREGHVTDRTYLKTNICDEFLRVSSYFNWV